MEELEFEADERKARFSYIDNLDNTVLVTVERKRMQQSIRNIIDNALKYGSKTSLTIDNILYQNDSVVCLDIKDNGQGIPNEMIPLMFDRFYRVDAERTKDFTSTGLGFAIAKELIEAHNGTLSVKSIEDEGTCFTLTLPCNTFFRNGDNDLYEAHIDN